MIHFVPPPPKKKKLHKTIVFKCSCVPRAFENNGLCKIGNHSPAVLRGAIYTHCFLSIKQTPLIKLENLILSNVLIRSNYHRERFGKLTSRALALRQRMKHLFEYNLKSSCPQSFFAEFVFFYLLAKSEAKAAARREAIKEAAKRDQKGN